ncbi:acetyltransferase [Azorhizobium oxalatiphilum]|uniref:Acetyltransferase n=1 Tax=Azorhizobium oxalatiphilum TaxID=980631 RepID=A0A917BTS7_9HYPH|nr:GNAT family N-acetyltransferase [Azorhizobium oxalatiphilum]GGF56043.1 acetyltransferase [Azorhizobium oxalatiphilum]
MSIPQLPFPRVPVPYSTPPEAIQGPRIKLRLWRQSDWDGLAAMLADPEVMEHLMPVEGRAASDEVARRIERHFATHGFGLWAIELPGISPFIGYTGLVHVPFIATFTPAVEIGWRIQKAFWGQGYVSEAARLTLADGFSRLDLTEILALTIPANLRSQAVMRRLGMSHDPAEDFDHPSVPPGHRLRRHVLYRLSRETFMAAAEDTAP